MDVCYRHPDRETGVSCSSCGRPICPECMTATQVGMRCPECARQRTPVRTMSSLRSEPTLTYVLIGINVIVFLGSVLGGAGLLGGGVSPLDVEGATLGRGTGALEGQGVAFGEPWRLVTGGFLHAGIAHLFLNMFLLYILGGLLEPTIGRLRFGVIYFVSLLCGSFGALLLTPTGFTRGASGAVFGLMAATFVIMRSRGIDPMQSGIGPLLLLNLGITFLLPGISIGGHIGGLVGGGLAALVMFHLRDRVRIPAAAANALAASLGVLAVVGSLAVVSG